MGQKSKEVRKNLEIRQRRTFSEEFKRQKVQLLIEKKISIKELSDLYKITRMTAYRWLYKYSPHHQKGTTQVVQMESEATKTKQFLHEVSKLERVVGQKQMEIDYLNKLIELASKEFKVDIKKNFSTLHSNGLDKIETNINTK